ncbi:hypothetical protein BYT27DRAFT_7304159 [Phlegmacium glaucopus]|nr:hypothetical protein BYT27DRAFT_7304159 [Phlegmacium glaucopus]
MGANNSKSEGPDEKVFQNEVPISFSPDVVNQLSDRLETSETTPERQLILDSHIRARIRDELEHLKKDEEDVRGEIERALEKENLDREKSMANDGDGTSSSILLGDMDEIRTRLEKYSSRRKDVEVKAEGDAVLECYQNHKATPLDCWSQVRNFKASVERVEQSHYNRS